MTTSEPTAAPTEATMSSIDAASVDSSLPSTRTGRTGSTRRIATIACIAALAGVALIGTLHPATAAGGAGPAASAPAASAPAASAQAASSAFGLTDSGINWPDLIVKGTIVLVLLFVTLRVLGRTGAGATKRGGRLEVLESRPLAPKASLHLVAVGDRRLVVGLTPSGMVALAELDAAELETESATTPAADPAAAPLDFAGLLGRRPAGTTAPTLGSALDTVLRPLDAVTGRVAGFLNGGRIR